MANRRTQNINKSSLRIVNLRVTIEGKPILKGVSLTVEATKVHAIMGPNGSGKSTLAYAIMGHPSYKSQIPARLAGGPNPKSQIKIFGKEITHLSSEERARAGLFLAFQSPIAIPGVSVVNLLRSAYQAIHSKKKSNGPLSIQNPVLARRWQADGMTLAQFTTKLKQYAAALRLDDGLLNRGIHDGFSGGEKKKIEMLQALMLSPRFAVFDEIDTGLDIDALKVVAKGIELLTKQGTGVLVITHYQRILKYIRPDVVHVLVDGRIVQTGTAKLAQKIEEKGYAALRN